MNDLSLVDALQPANWPTFVLVSARLVGLALVAPLWSMAGVPRSVRGAMVVVISLALLPTVSKGHLPDDLLGLPIPLASELMLGLAIGLVGAVFLHGIGMAGEVAALQMGLNLGEAITPMAEGTVTGVGELQSMLALVLYVTLGGHLTLLAGLGQSFQAIPPGGALDFADGARALVDLGGTVFATALRAAAPIIAALLLANFALAILSRAVPQLNAMAVAFPITIGAGLLVLGAALPFTGALVGRWVAGLDGAVGAMVQSFTPVRGH